MKALGVLVALIVVFIMGLVVSDRNHAWDFDDGWKQGYAVGKATGKIAGVEAERTTWHASGICNYANMVCTK